MRNAICTTRRPAMSRSVVSPFEGFDSLFESLFDSGGFFPAVGNDARQESGFDQRAHAPRVNITDSDEKLNLTFELPGIDKENIKVLVRDGVLTVSGERKVDTEVKDDGVVRREIRSGSFSRSFTLPDTVEHDSISADYSNGLLEITLAKKEETKPKEISVKVN